MRFPFTLSDIIPSPEGDEAVQARIWELAIKQVKANTAKSQEEIELIIDEAVTWAQRS